MGGKTGAGTGQDPVQGRGSIDDKVNETRVKIGTETHQRLSGKNLSKNLSKDLFANDYAAFMEAFSNSLDENANNIWITYDGETLVIEDDGNGSNKNGLDDFYRIAESTKTAGKISEQGRPTIGNKGFGTLALRYLCGSYALETWNSGEERVIKETFSDYQDDTKKIQTEIFKGDEKRHGMRITMAGLNAHKEGRDFTVDGLIKYLERNMPNRCDYRAFVNKKEVKPIKMRNATEYAFSIDTIDTGNVSGVIYVCRQNLAPDERGVTIRVNGRPVGNKDHFRIGPVYGMGLGSRLIADINADGLAGKVGFDRTRFETGHPAFKEVEDAIKGVLNSIHNDYSAEKRVAVRQKVIDDFQEKTLRILGKAKKQYAEWGIQELEFADEDKAGKIARIGDGRVYINQDLIRLNKVGDSSFQSQLETAIAFAAAQLIFEKKYSSGKTGKQNMDAMLELEERFALNLQKIHAKQKPLSKIITVKADKYTALNSHRLYTSGEIHEKKGVSHIFIRRLTGCGALNEAIVGGEVREDKFSAHDIAGILRKVENYTPVYEIMQEICKEEQRVYSNLIEQSMNSKLKNSEDNNKLPEYVLRLGNDNTPFYIVKKGFEGNFKELVKSKDLDLIPKKREFKISLESLMDDKGIDEMPEPGEKDKIIDYTPKKMYNEGDYITHYNFGVGWVIGAQTNKCMIIFRNGEKKVLAMGRKEGFEGFGQI